MSSLLFEELGYRETPIGVISLRRRRDPGSDVDVYEILLGDEFLMSSRVTASEIALADLVLNDVDAPSADVLVGGLGLGYTAEAVLKHDNVASVQVVDALEAVIDWHRDGLIPLGNSLTADPRCQFVLGDFFELARSEAGFDAASPARRYDAIIVDIDHAPDRLLHGSNAWFYQTDGLARVVRRLKPGGIFGLWSDDVADEAFVAKLGGVFPGGARAAPVTFLNPLQGRTFTQTVYLGKT